MEHYKSSAIMQMLIGARGNLESIRLSEKHQKAQRKSLDKIIELEKQLKKYPQILELYKEVQEASNLEYLLYSEEVYKEAFAFGLAIGQEVFSK
ncbi:MAG: hypothetical protein K2J89_01540 [Clostridia bacterium]|nr:hypothetical protein [Clostridia bacterium]